LNCGKFCYKGSVYKKCGEVGGGDAYDPVTHFCYKDEEVRKK